jgi:hypothetical protein
MLRKCLLFLALLVVLVSLSACSALGGLDSLTGEVTAESEETQSVIVPGVPTLIVDHFAGNVTIRDGEADKITANLTRQSRLNDAAEAQAQLDLITMTFTQSGTDVTLSVKGRDGISEGLDAATANLELLVPPGTVLDVNLGAGNLTVERPSGDVTVNLGAGNATVTLPEEASFNLSVSGGVGNVNSEFEGVPDGGIATDIDTTIGDSPTQTLTFNVGAGDINLNIAP